jgi:hypothetical protein
MTSMVLGYSTPTSPREIARASQRAFCSRVKALGLTVLLDTPGHTVAATGPSVHAPVIRGRWHVVHFDGALHRKSGLAMHGVRPDSMTDADAAEHLLCEFGYASLEWLVGDWAVAAISSDSLLLATDYFGNRALAYHVDDDGAVVWSNQQRVLAEFVDRTDALDAVHLAGLLYFLPPPDRTPFREVRSIPAGHAGVFGPSGCAVRPYWTPRSRRITLADSREYGGTFVELLRQGVSDRLAVSGRKWVEISGGVDSALVAGCARACVRAEDGLDCLEAVHYTTDRPEGAADTRRAREAAAQYGLPLRTFSLEALLQRSATACIEDPLEPLGAFREVPRLAAREGVRVLLSGRLGDLVTGNREPEPGLLLDLAARQGLRSALQELRSWAVFAETPVWYLLARLVRDRLSTREAKLFASFTDRTRRKSGNEHDAPSPSGPIAPALDEAVRAWRGFLNWPGRDALDYVDVWWWFAIHTMRLSGSYRSSWAAGSCDRTYPMSHRPLLEFLVSCPWTAFLAPSRPRLLVHEQLGHLLPRSLVGNVLKSDTATWRIAPLRDLWASTLGHSPENAKVVERGLFTAGDIERLGAALRTGRGPAMAIFPRLLQVELWLRTRPRRIAAMYPNDKGGDSYALRKA